MSVKVSMNWVDFGIGLLMAFLVGAVAFNNIICPKKKRREAANRITAVVALLAYSLTVLAALFIPQRPEFSLNLFLLEGVLVGAITMGIIYGIAQAIHWAIRGKPM